MAQSSAAHSQPTMDEILSSIRKIIEDGDKSAKAAPIAAEAPSAMPPNIAPAANDTAPITQNELDNFAQALDARSDVEFSDDELAAAASIIGSVEPVDDVRFSADDRHAFARVADALNEKTQSSPAPTSKPDLVAVSPAFGLDQPLKPKIETTSAPEPKVVAAPSQIKTLVSQAASKSVASSLEALSNQLAKNNGPDLAAMTEEMLKPMLSDWLDNNLPSMVERLVRAEIERIARGEPRQD